MLLEARSGGEITDKIHNRRPTSFEKAVFISQDHEKFRITVVHDPAVWFVSAYRDKIIGRGRINSDLPVSDFIKNIDSYLP